MKKDAKIETKKNLSVRGKLIEAKIIRMKSKKTAHVEVKTIKYIPKYERYLVKKSRFAVHVPDEITVAVGDTVLCGETRKISKTKSMIILKKIDVDNTKSEKLKKTKSAESTIKAGDEE